MEKDRRLIPEDKIAEVRDSRPDMGDKEVERLTRIGTEMSTRKQQAAELGLPEPDFEMVVREGRLIGAKVNGSVIA